MKIRQLGIDNLRKGSIPPARQELHGKHARALQGYSTAQYRSHSLRKGFRIIPEALVSFPYTVEPPLAGTST
jgi:hypothetical protein